MAHLALQMARHRVTALLAVAFAVLGGAALVTGIGVLAESGLRSHAPAGRLATADVVVSADQTFRPGGDLPIALPERARVGADWVDRVRRLPGVAVAVGDVSFPAAVVDAHGRTVPAADPSAADPSAADPSTAGHGWSSTALLDRAVVTGTAPAGDGEVAVDDATASAAGVRPGDRVRVVAAGHPGTYRVSAVVTAASGGGVYFADSTAMRLTGRDGVDLIAVRATPGAGAPAAAAVRDAVRGSGLIVSTGAARGDVEAPGTIAARHLLPVLAGSLAGVTLLVVGFIVAGALAVSIGAQRRDLALLRAVGATPRQIRGLAAGQATVVAAAALVPGVVAGYLLAGQFRAMLVAIDLLPPALPLTVSPLPAVAAVLLSLAVVQVSARCVVRRTSRMPATEAVAQSRSEPRTPGRLRGVVGLNLIILANALAVGPLVARTQIGAAGTATAGIVAAIGLALAGPALLRRAGGALARRLPPGVSAPTWLAVANQHGYALRSAAAVTTLAMAVVFTLTYAYTQTTVTRATSDQVEAGTRADLSITAPGLGGIPDGLLHRVRDTPGVLAVAPVSTTAVVWPYRLAGDVEAEMSSALVLDPAAPGVLDLDVRSGSTADLTGDTVAVDAEAARTRRARIGSEVSVVLGDGSRVRARVVAVYARGLGFGPVALSRDLAAGHTTTGLDQSLLVRTDGADATRRGLAALVAGQPGVAIADDTTGSSPGGSGTVAPELWINIAVLGVLLGYLLLGIANKLIAGTVQRREELALLRLIGATTGQIRAMMRREAALTGTAALVTGMVLSVVPLLLLAVGFLGRPWPAGPLWLVPAVAAVVAAVTFLSIELPTRRTLRIPPVVASNRG